MNENKITPYWDRRTFLKYSLITLAGVLGLDSVHNFASQFNSGAIENANQNWRPRFPLPQNLVGLSINAPYAYLATESEIHHMVKNMKILGASNVRIFLDDGFEPQLGNYDKVRLGRVRNFSRTIYEKSEGTIGIIPSMIDGYTLFHSDRFNPVYGSKPISSPYIIDKQKKNLKNSQVQFFTDHELKRVFTERLKFLISGLVDLPNINAWELGNELEVYAQKETARAILTDWYDEMVGDVRALDPIRSICTGLAKPWQIDESPLIGKGVVNTAHLYIKPSDRLLDEFHHFLPKSRLPLILGETGMPRKFGPFRSNTNSLMFSFIKRILELSSVGDRFYVGQIGLWQMDPRHRDGYEIDPVKDPEFGVYCQWLGNKLHEIYTGYTN